MTKAKSQIFFLSSVCFSLSIWQFMSVIWWFKINNLKSFTEVLGKAFGRELGGHSWICSAFKASLTVSQELEGNWTALHQLLNSLRSLKILCRLRRQLEAIWSRKYFSWSTHFLCWALGFTINDKQLGVKTHTAPRLFQKWLDSKSLLTEV